MTKNIQVLSNLKPCPFCNVHDCMDILGPFHYSHHNEYYIFCRNCKTKGPIQFSDQLAKMAEINGRVATGEISATDARLRLANL